MLSTEPALIQRQVKTALRLGFRPSTAAEAAARPDARLLHVTFDDAYRSVAGAVDALEPLGVPLTVFVCTGFADAGGATAIPELAEEIAAHPAELASMSWDELRYLAARGVEIGSHTISHPHLPSLSTDAIGRELVESRRRVETEIGKPCRLLAYPYGEHDERCRRIAEAAGYDLAFAIPPIPVDRGRAARRRVRSAAGGLVRRQRPSENGDEALADGTAIGRAPARAPARSGP